MSYGNKQKAGRHDSFFNKDSIRNNTTKASFRNDKRKQRNLSSHIQGATQPKNGQPIDKSKNHHAINNILGQMNTNSQEFLQADI